MTRLPLYTLLLVSLAANAQIYKTVDEQGNVTFSDMPTDRGASERVEVQQTNTTPPPPMAVPRDQPQSEEEEPEAVTYQPTITSPANETTIPMGPGNFSVSAQVEPPLESGAALQLFMDGNPQGVPQESANWSLTNVFRGAHDLEVAVVDMDGNELARSPAVRVYVLRPSVNNRNRRN